MRLFKMAETVTLMTGSAEGKLDLIKGEQYVASDIYTYEISQIFGETTFETVVDLDEHFLTYYKGEDLSGKKLLVWRTGGAGDIMFASPALRYIKEKWPTSHISFACAGRYLPVARSIPAIDDAIMLPFNYNMIKNTDYHVMFDGLIERNEEAKKHNAYDLFTAAFSLTDKIKNMIPYLVADKKTVEDCKRLFRLNGIIDDDIVIGYHIRSSSIIRDLPVTMALYQIKGLSEAGFKIVILGSTEDGKTVDQFPTMQNTYNFCNDSDSFYKFIAAVSLCDIIIGPDSSALHIAAALDKPMMGMYGAFKSELRMKYFKKALGLDIDIKCSPCYSHGDKPCKNAIPNGSSPCMFLHNIDMIINTATSLSRIALGRVPEPIIKDKKEDYKVEIQEIKMDT